MRLFNLDLLESYLRKCVAVPPATAGPRATGRAGSSQTSPPTHRRKRRPALLTMVVLAVAALLAACSSSSSSTKSSSSTAGSSTTLAAAAAGVCTTPNPATGSPVTIGMINDEGSAVTNQIAARQAAIAAVDYANDCLGGLGGHKITTTLCVTKSDPAVALACANQMVSDNVIAVVAPTSALGDSIVPTVTKAGIPYAASSAQSPPELTSPMSHIWTVAFPGQLYNMALYAKNHGVQKVAIFAVNTGNIVASTQALAGLLFKPMGVTATVVGTPATAVDLSSSLAEAMQGQPQALIAVVPPQQCVSLYKAEQTAGTKVANYTIIVCVDKNSVEAVGAANMNGYVLFDQADYFGTDSEVTLYNKIMAKYAPSDTEDPTASHGYQSMLGLIRAVNAGGLTGSPTPSAVQAAIVAAKNVPVPLGGGQNMTCDGTASLALKSVCSSFSVSGVMQNGVPTDAQVSPVPPNAFGG
jgi:branched-chain amino acid transport system substrate-binding protein